MYLRTVFDAESFEHGKNIVITPDQDIPNKFELETARFMDFIDNNLHGYLNSSSVVLDYGCGVGRLSKAMIDQYDCKVFGKDISERMLDISKEYVNSRNYICGTEIPLDLKFDLVFSVLVLQHAERPEYDIQKIRHHLKDNGCFILLNEKYRLVPKGIDNNGYVNWEDDKVDVFKLTKKYFDLVWTDNEQVSVWRK